MNEDSESFSVVDEVLDDDDRVVQPPDHALNFVLSRSQVPDRGQVLLQSLKFCRSLQQIKLNLQILKQA